MREGLLWVLGLWFLGAGQLFAQSLPATNPPEAKATLDSNKPADVSSDPAIVSLVSTVDSITADRSWARVDYLLWWVKNAPLPVPIVTTGASTNSRVSRTGGGSIG